MRKQIAIFEDDPMVVDHFSRHHNDLKVIELPEPPKTALKALLDGKPIPDAIVMDLLKDHARDRKRVDDETKELIEELGTDWTWADEPLRYLAGYAMLRSMLIKQPDLKKRVVVFSGQMTLALQDRLRDLGVDCILKGYRQEVVLARRVRNLVEVDS